MKARVRWVGSNRVRWLLVVVAFSLCFNVGQLASAQDESPGVRQWAQPTNISQSPGDSSDPAMVADRAGMVHLFWSERFGDEIDSRGQRIHGNTLMYSRWRDGEWSTPNDVLVSPDGSEIWQPAVVVDQFGVLHVIWASAPGGRLYYSHAPVAQALSAQGWLVPKLLHSGLPTFALPAGIAVDSRGVVHVIATGSDIGQEVFHIASTDGGFSWSSPTSLSSKMPGLPADSLVSGGIAVYIDARDNLHAGWSMFNREGFGVVIYYTRSSDSGATWSTPFVVGEKAETDYEADWLNIAVVGENRIHLVWTGIGRPPGRIYRTSFDGGMTWTPATPFMEGLVGETESPRMVVDSAGVVHLFTPARTVTTDTGVRYAYWAGQTWTRPTKIPGPPPDPGAYPALGLTATINLGNQIWVAWYDQPKGEVFVTHGESGAPVVAPTSFFERQTEVVQEHDAAPQNATATTSAPLATTKPSSTAVSDAVIFQPSETYRAEPNPLFPVLAGGLPAFALIVGVLLVHLSRLRRHR
jgi:hypothetical protein